MIFSDKIDHYLAGELPLEEAQAFERALTEDPELAMELHLHQLENDLDAWETDELELRMNGWLPGLDLLRESGMPLWLMSLLAGSVVVGMAGARLPKKRPSPSSARPSQDLFAAPSDGAGASDEASPPSESIE